MQLNPPVIGPVTGQSDSWFSCRVRFAHLATSSESLLLRTSVYLFIADSYESAHPRALEIGRREEQVYPNGAGGMTRIAMVEIEAIDQLDEIEDGIEVACLWSDEIEPSPYTWDQEFHPEKSKPWNTL